MDMPPSKGLAPLDRGGRPPAVDIASLENPRSVINLITPAVKDALEVHLWESPELFTQNERELMNVIRGRKGQKPHGIGPTENRLRVAFWMEYDRAIESGETMNMGRVYGGICPQDYFHREVIRQGEKLAWMLCPPASYTIAMEEALVYGIEKLRDVLDFPLYDKKGEPNVRVGELILKMVQMLDARKHGAIVQKIQTMNLHKHEKVLPPQPNMGELDAKLKQLEDRAIEIGLPVKVEDVG